MATLIESHRVAAGSQHRVHGSAQSSFSRKALPFLVATLGIFIGTATGIVLGMLTTPGGAAVESGDFVQASSPTAEAEVSPAVNTTPAQVIHPAVAPPAGSISQQNADTSESAAKVADLILPPANPAINARPPSAAQIVDSPKPVALKAATLRLSGHGRFAARRIAKPVARPARLVLASAPLDAPTALDAEQWSLDDEAKPSSTTIEGDLTVTDYDGKTGTIETSDGRTFMLGMTVSASDATSWDDYRSDVHYRCGQNGGCALTRAGVVAPNARLI